MTARQLRFHHRLQLAAQVMKKTADQHLLQHTGISTAQAAVLAVVAEQEHTSQRRIAAALKLNESAVTAMVDRLLKLGLLSRRRRADDRRAWELALTALGRQRTRQASSAFNAINRRIESLLSAEELEITARALATLTEHFTEH
ncbi:MarR family winged helix-turn-helix transcriptional regulator [Parahaliea mediterranea]|uniref:Winged helix-turn-helix transcriptional regulator n=1 Tax=Parahaliea mediterranea TaxID=651086 RepID=A0A939DG70_9GAMM|nr:MarR family winged helix-turn-helix transcriptional regulator [Parahaliea mediterranea]MBN7797678.1 winged helix-turn-helix transcriptional regulator [Parahaliea mediterranea]